MNPTTNTETDNNNNNFNKKDEDEEMNVDVEVYDDDDHNNYKQISNNTKNLFYLNGINDQTYLYQQYLKQQQQHKHTNQNYRTLAANKKRRLLNRNNNI